MSQTCTHRLLSPQNPSCPCFSMAPTSSDGSLASAAPRNRPGRRSLAGLKRRRDRICRRGSPTRPVRNRRQARRDTAFARRYTPVATAKRPRRMGLRGEVADGGEIWRTTPPSRADTSAARPRFSGANGPAKFVAGTLNLSHSIQTKPCLGHCITRGIGLRRQATILRLRGAVLFGGAEAGPVAGIRTRMRG